MRLALTVVTPAAGQRAEVILDADPATPVGEVAAELAGLAADVPGRGADGYGQVLAFPGPRAAPADLAAARSVHAPPAGSFWPAAPPVFVNGLLIPPDLPLAASPLRAGSVISLGDPSGCLPPEPAGPVELRVVGGPAAGRVHRLSLGSADVGSSALATVRILDPAVPAHALTVTVDARGQATVAAPAGAGVLLGRRPLAGAAAWHPGQQVAVGFSLLELALYEPPDAALEPAEDGGGLDFNRPPRLLPPDAQTRFALPVPPTKDERRPLPILMAVVPVVMGVGMAVLLHEVYMLAMCVMSPVLMVGNHIADGKRGRRSFASRTAEFREHKARIEQDAAAALGAERQRRMAAAPDPAAVLTIATGPRRRLWERRGTDPDYLMLRLGTADLPSAVELQDPAQDEHRRTVVWGIPDAPVTVPLAERGVLGVAGPGDEPRALGRWLAAQIAVLHSPNDVQLCVLTDSSGRASWEWARWLPHCQQPGAGGAGGAAGALIGNDAETVGARIAELQAAISERQKILRESSASGGVRFGSIVVVLDGSRRLRWLPGVLQVLRDGPATGVYAICLDAGERLLPAECQAVAVTERGGLRVQQMNTATLTGVRPDAAAPDWCARLARGIAPIRDISTDESSAGLPESSRLLDVLGLEPPDAAVIATRWRAAGQSTLAIVGEAYDGPFGIDIRRDGPHGLIAGTTGSGKSELLQTIVAALAVANRPDAMTFVLIDYKGGSAFKDCVRLPHTVGMVTDLDPHLVERALASLSAELTRREHILAGAGAKDIEDYTDQQERIARAGGGPVPLPRLMIVIDEFASMVRDLPDFVTGLVNIAQRGRSLGIHLLLATQRPSGVVSPEIRANTNLRIALRVTDTAESADVIDAPDAGHISKSTPGRAYVRLGHSSLVPFQAGRVGGRRPGAVAATVERPWLARLDWAELGRPWPQRPAGARAEEAEITDLTVLVRAICQATEAMRLPAPNRPWLPALPGTLLLGDLPAPLPPPAGGQRGPLPLIPFGLDDLPAQQDQRPAALDLASFGHMMVAGAPRSGRSQLLRTIAGAVGLHHRAADVHLYGLDCGNGALLPIADLPHCGAVVLRTQPERATRLMSRLARELSRRQEQLADGGFADIGEQRAAAAGASPGGTGASPGGPLPHILILLDRWEGFTAALGELDGGRLTETVTRILAEGASAGLHLVMTGDRSLIAGRISSLTDDKMVLRLPDRDDVNLVGLRPRDLPEAIPPGHGFRAGSGVETQVALLAPDASGVGQATALREIAAAATARAAGTGREQRPFRVDVLPARLSFGDAWPLRDPAAARSPLWALVGVGGDDLAALGPDLADGMPAFIVGGPAKSGRSSVLLAMARSLLAAGTGVVAVAPRPSPLRGLDGRAGVTLLTGSDLTADELTTALAAVTGPAAVIIDDAEGLRDCGAGDQLKTLVAYGGDQSRALVFGGNAEDLCSGFSGWQVDARKARRGCLLSPQQITDGDLIGLRLPRSLIGEPVRPGRALLNTGDGTLRTVAVPLD
jgi:S-DNA-T family DNA segregation ATPase FtsK/SpoIIIE